MLVLENRVMYYVFKGPKKYKYECMYVCALGDPLLNTLTEEGKLQHRQWAEWRCSYCYITKKEFGGKRFHANYKKGFDCFAHLKS